jgi:hypothetical protein
MKLRFSLKWLLAAMAYLALVLAAVLQPDGIMAKLLWLVHSLLILQLGLVVCFYRGQAQAFAIGFLLFFAASFAAHEWRPGYSPRSIAKAALNVGGPEFERRQSRLDQNVEELLRVHGFDPANAEVE